MTVLSSDAEASVCPSGLNATPVTPLVWPRSGSPRGLPDLTSQRITVLSPDAEASVSPSGLNATPITGLVCPRWKRFKCGLKVKVEKRVL